MTRSGASVYLEVVVMSDARLLIMFTPFFVIVTGFCIIVVVALCQAAPTDVPTVFRDSLGIFKRLVEYLRWLPFSPTRYRRVVSSPSVEELTVADTEGEADPDMAGNK
jgi:hypothetical protein